MYSRPVKFAELPLSVCLEIQAESWTGCQARSLAHVFQISIFFAIVPASYHSRASRFSGDSQGSLSACEAGKNFATNNRGIAFQCSQYYLEMFL